MSLFNERTLWVRRFRANSCAVSGSYEPKIKQTGHVWFAPRTGKRSLIRITQIGRVRSSSLRTAGKSKVPAPPDAAKLSMAWRRGAGYMGGKPLTNPGFAEE